MQETGSRSAIDDEDSWFPLGCDVESIVLQFRVVVSRRYIRSFKKNRKYLRNHLNEKKYAIVYFFLKMLDTSNFL